MRINDKWVEEVREVKEGICKHFKSIFAARTKQFDIPTDLMCGRKLSSDISQALEEQFSEEEVRRAIWRLQAG